MQYFLGILLFIVISTITTILTAFLGLLIPILYLFAGFVLTTESLAIGIGGFFGSLVCIYATNKYIKEQGAFSRTPMRGKIASIGYIISFSMAIILKYILNYNLNNINYWYIFFVIIFLWVVLSYFSINTRKKDLKNLKESVESYKIIKKYEDDPGWGIYLYLKNGREVWNKTIPGSFMAKDPKNDLTFVFNTKERALSYAKHQFPEAKHIKE